MKFNLLSIELRYEQDVVLTRQRARQVAGLLGFTAPEQTGIATAVSEIARNAFRYAGGGRVEFGLTDGDPPVFSVRVRDDGPGITNLQQILDGRYTSQTGMGLGILGARRLSDDFEVATRPGGGTTVVLGKYLPRGGVTPQRVASIGADLAQRTAETPFQEVQQQNRELLVAMAELASRQAEVERLNAELGETNRGVLALYAELDEKAESLRRASELKSRFLSDLSHELRTPLNAMISLSGLLLDRTDGDLTGEQEKQVRFIRKSAESLREMVNDLLDLAKIEAGKTELRPSAFQVADLLGALRGMFRPLLANDAVSLVVEEPAVGVGTIYSDEGKLSQILRNFISNALKFTERGEVRVRAEGRCGEDGSPGLITFSVSDTGIGIAPADRERIFEDFAQVDGPLQRRVRGTGLGLPLARKLAELLGGHVAVESEFGAGSTFSVTVPVRCPGAADPAQPVQAEADVAAAAAAGRMQAIGGDGGRHG